MATHRPTGPAARSSSSSAYRVMRTIREFEERLHREFATGEIPGFVHLYAGEEAIAAGVFAHLAPTTTSPARTAATATPSPRAATCTAMMAEIYGKSDGLCHGKGGSMHIADLDKGMLGANGIVGGGPPLVCGVGLTAKVSGPTRSAVSFTGDGGSNQGTFLESLNLAARLAPAVRLRGREQRLRRGDLDRFHQAGVDVAKRADGFGMPGRGGRRPRLLRRPRGGRRGDRARPRRRRPDAARVQGQPLLRPLRGRPADLPRPGRGRGAAPHPRLPGRASRAA